MFRDIGPGKVGDKVKFNPGSYDPPFKDEGTITYTDGLGIRINGKPESNIGILRNKGEYEVIKN